MKIKRYLDKDMRQVLRRVRNDQGPDALILSNRRVSGGIEVIAALDYDEALIQQALGSQPESARDSQSAIIKRTQEEASATEAGEIRDGENIDILSADLRSSVPDEFLDTDPGDPSNVWTQEPTLVAMRSEMSSMRSLLETQLSGLLWKERSRKFPMRAEMLRNLSRIGLAPDIATIIANQTAPVKNSKNLWRAPLATLAKTLPVVDDDLFRNGGIAALIGPTGVGKTTTIAKIAVRYAMEHGSDEIALISADAFRVGAKEHLMAFANIIGVKVYGASKADDVADILERLRSKKLILIDTEGMRQLDMELSSKLAAYGNNNDRVKFYLTLSAASQEAALDEAVRRFNKVPLAGAIVTKLDEAAQLGCIFSTLIRNNLPMAYLSAGQHVPDDLHAAVTKRLWLVNRAFESAKSSGPRINERIMAENFSLMSAADA